MHPNNSERLNNEVIIKNQLSLTILNSNKLSYIEKFNLDLVNYKKKSLIFSKFRSFP